ncbi:MAG TPA: GNAT family N-acetyltransferase [Usitatibacter sp.]|nr:GNAT family N-acetyltransferase [Usitatibacter sp.]
MTDWRFARFDELSPREIHDLYRARAAAFVVEQGCAFQDLDGADPECWHLLGHEGSELVAYARLVPPGVKFAEPSIGRVVTTQAARGTGRGRALMAEALARAEKLWPGRPIRIGAQHRLERFYEEFGFVTSSAPYDEDGILHVEMVRPAGRAKQGRGQTVG